MRAIFHDETNLSEGAVIEITGDRAKHLISSVRIRLNEKVVILNNTGALFYSSVVSLEKKTLSLEINKVEIVSRPKIPNLALCLTKKEAFEDIIKNAVELGIQRIYPLKSQYSMDSIGLKKDRIDRIIESSVIQSNNAFGIEIENIEKFDNIEHLIKNYEKVFYFTSSSSSTGNTDSIQDLGRSLVIIGPEGGLSPVEEVKLEKLGIEFIHIPTNILRAKTAVCVAIGYVIAKNS